MGANLEFQTVAAQIQPARSLLIVLHGTGQTVDHILPQARVLHDAMPGADIICPQGPEIFTSRKNGIGPEDGLRTWIRHDTLHDQGLLYLQLLFNRVSILNDLHALIDRELEARNLDDRRLGIFGFSMGGMIALMTAFTRAASPAAAVSHSGMFFPYEYIRTAPPTLWIMGDADKRYDVSLTREKRGRSGVLSRYFNYYHSASVTRLEQDGIPLETKIIPGLGHDISAESMQYAAAFLKNRLER